MAFYEDISKYYDLIFPTGAEQLDFIRQEAGRAPAELLDIACGTGGYSVALAKAGYDVTAADIDRAMIEGLRQKISGTGLGEGAGKVHCIAAGMLEMEESLPKGSFDLAFCIGNSVVHLDNEAEIGAFFKAAKRLLKDGGKFIVQIINFDRVLLKDVRELPALKNDEAGLTFERYYRFDKAANKVFFRTVLSVEKGVSESLRVENEIPLYPLQSTAAEALLRAAGFNNIKLFGDFKESSYEKENSFMLVILAS